MEEITEVKCHPDDLPDMLRRWKKASMEDLMLRLHPSARLNDPIDESEYVQDNTGEAK